MFLHAHLLRPGEFDPAIQIMVKTETIEGQESEILSLTLDRLEVPLTFPTARLGGLLGSNMVFGQLPVNIIPEETQLVVLHVRQVFSGLIIRNFRRSSHGAAPELRRRYSSPKGHQF